MGFSKSLKWSHSRGSLLRDGCLRRFFYRYYYRGETEYATKAAGLNALVNPPMLAGHVVDRQIRHALEVWRTSRTVTTGLSESGLKATENTLRSSKAVAQRIREGKTLAFGAQALHVDYYGDGIEAAAKDRMKEQVARALDGFERCGVWERIREVPTENWMPTADREGDEARVGFSVEGVEVSCQIDWWASGPRNMRIVDFKAGRSDSSFAVKTAAQLAVYALWAEYQGFARDQVKVQAVYVGECPDWEPRRVSDVELEAIKAQIKADNAAERALVVERREGRSLLYDADAKDFPPSPERGRCAACSFRELCEEGCKAIL